KSDEEAEREREEDPIGRRDAGPREHESPAPCPPLPRCLRVEPAERLTARARRLVDPDVALERIREIGAEGWTLGLIRDEFLLERERQPVNVVPRHEVSGCLHTRRGQLPSDYRVAARSKPITGISLLLL